MLETMQEIRRELNRADARDVRIRLDPDFKPEVGTLLEVSIDNAYWHVFPADFLELVKGVPDGQGAQAIKQQIEKDCQFVWHGPAPRSRDTSP